MPRLDRTALSIGHVREKSDEDDYWRSKTPAERWEALELNRSIAYGYGTAPPRLQRILEVVKRNKKASGRYKDLDDLEHL